MRALAAVVLVLLTAPLTAGAGPRRPGRGLALSYVERPLALPEDLCRVHFLGGGTKLSPDYPAARMRVGASCGISDNLEGRFWVLSLLASRQPGSGLEPFLAGLRYRLWEGPVAAAVGGHLRVTFGNQFGAGAELRLRARLDPWLALELTPEVEYLNDAEARGAAPVSLTVQILPRLGLIASYEAWLPDLEETNILGRWGAGLRFSWPDEQQRAGGDLRLMVFGPAHTLDGAPPSRTRYGEAWTVELSVAPLMWMPESQSPRFDDF